MRLLYRADGGHPIGTGHVHRAVRIIRELRRTSPVSAALVTGDTTVANAISGQTPAFVVPTTPSYGPDSVKPAFRFSSIAGLDCLEPPDWDVIAVDMLDTEADEMSRLTEYGVPVVTFDDRGDGRTWASAVVNSLVMEPLPACLPSVTRLYEGFQYAVLDPLYARMNGTYAIRGGPIEKVFVTLGGGDAAGLAVKVARALMTVRGIRRVDFAVGPAFPFRNDLEDALTAAPWEFDVLAGLPNLADRYLGCDLAVIAGGLTMYEACCIGVPSLAVCQPIDHQLELSQRFAAEGAMATVGYGQEASEEKIANEVERLSRDEARRKEMTVHGPRLVDGRGVERVASIVKEVGRRK